MEYYTEKISVPFEAYVHVYHTGDPQLDELLGFFKNDDYGISVNIKISHSPQVPNRGIELAEKTIRECEFVIRNDCIIMEMFCAKIKFRTKEEFAILKMLLESSIFSLILNLNNTYSIFDDPDLLCTFRVQAGSREIKLIADCVNIKYRFEYTHSSKIMDINEFNIETLVEFMNVVCVSAEEMQKLKNVQVYLLIDDREIPGYFFGKRHKIIIENTYSIQNETNLKPILEKYIKNNTKLPELLPNGCKSAKEIC